MRPDHRCALVVALALTAPVRAAERATPVMGADHAALAAPAPVLMLPAGGEEFRRSLLAWSAAEAPVAASLDVLQMPIAPTRLSSRFGYRHDPLGHGLRAHLGIDIPDRLSAPVHAAAGGLVVFAGRSGSYGNLIQIDHGAGSETRYGHLSAITVEVGAVVRQGTVIGLVGSTGRSTGPHLHFEVRQDGRPIDPLSRLGEAVAAPPDLPAPAPAREHWAGFGANADTLPQSRLQ